MLLKEDEVVHDVYKIERFLGEGAFAEVYRVKHKFLGRQAMKVFKHPSTSLKEVEETLSEAVILSRIGHPNIIRVFDAGITETKIGQCGFFTMEYVAGGDLGTFWQAHGAKFVLVPDAIEIIRQVCRGLAAAHSEQPPIIHRDIKPQNILVGYDAVGLRVRVSDFGLAKRVNPLTLLASGGVGTRGFKPPEFLLNVDSCAGDVWGIGATLYLLLTDHFPYQAHGETDFLSEKCWERPLIPASHFNARVDPVLDAILSRALALKPADRYPNAKAMLDELMKWKPPEVRISETAKESIDRSKGVLGRGAQKPKEFTVKKMLSEALRLSRHPNKLSEAADLLEEVLNRSPELRDRYEYRLKLWRRGVSM